MKESTLRNPKCQDIAAREQVEAALTESENKFEAIARAAQDAIIMLDDQGLITYWNLAAERILGYSAHEILGRDMHLLLAPQRYHEAHRKAFGPFRTSGQGAAIGKTLELEAVHKDGHELPIELSVSATQLKSQWCAIGVMRDITERKRAEEALRAAKAQAEQALLDLKAAQASLIRAEKLASLSQLVAGVAHEINTPVGTALTIATALERRTEEFSGSLATGTLTKTEANQYAGFARDGAALLTSNIQRAADLVQSFKRVAVDQTSGARRSFRLGTYIDEVLRSLAPRLKKTPHVVQVDYPEDIEVDSYPGALAQVLTNLIMNSVDHAFPEGHAGHIAIMAEPAADDTMVLHYADDGCGIPKPHLRQIFDPFFTTKRNAGGTGLGLHIVFNIVTTTLGGTINVESRVGEGTRFDIQVPRTAPAAPVSKEQP